MFIITRKTVYNSNPKLIESKSDRISGVLIDLVFSAGGGTGQFSGNSSVFSPGH